jgi:hypothetical protein
LLQIIINLLGCSTFSSFTFFVNKKFSHHTIKSFQLYGLPKHVWDQILYKKTAFVHLSRKNSTVTSANDPSAVLLSKRATVHFRSCITKKKRRSKSIQSQHLLSLVVELIIVHNVAGTRPSKTHCISIASDSAGIKYENNLWINHYISTQLTLGRFMKIIFLNWRLINHHHY